MFLFSRLFILLSGQSTIASTRIDSVFTLIKEVSSSVPHPFRIAVRPRTRTHKKRRRRIWFRSGWRKKKVRRWKVRFFLLFGKYTNILSPLISYQRGVNYLLNFTVFLSIPSAQTKYFIKKIAGRVKTLFLKTASHFLLSRCAYQHFLLFHPTHLRTQNEKV